jgi:hypothetical protein
MKNDRARLVLPLALFASGSTGTVVGAVISTAVDTDPAWLGPAVLMGGLALLLVAALLAPAALRAWRARKAP